MKLLLLTFMFPCSTVAVYFERTLVHGKFERDHRNFKDIPYSLNQGVVDSKVIYY